MNRHPYLECIPWLFPTPFTKWRPHPWHGLEAGPEPPGIVTAFIELTPFDTVKYEVDKKTGYLRVDRPQRTTSRPPHLYGFIPRTFCGERVADLSPDAAVGDKDPLDVCVISERSISHPDILLEARVVGGLQMVDGNEADDKIIAVLLRDHMFGNVRDISDLPPVTVERLRHYFLTYKMTGDKRPDDILVEVAYGHEHAHRVVTAAMDDYADEYGD